jgi:prolyl-tRNA editing enzyme YbaK/EbsC (Cys-tRNA(Pro) deacylase)
MEVLVFGPWSDDQEEGLECLLVEDTIFVTRAEGEKKKKHVRRLLKKLRQRFRRTRLDLGSRTSVTSCSKDGSLLTKSTLSESSWSSDGSCSIPPLIESRILDMGILDRNDFTFVPDMVSKEVIVGLSSNETHQDIHMCTSEESEENIFITHVKTGIWQITCLDDDGSPRTPFYVVTAVSMNDRVDTKKLRKAIFSGRTFTRRPKISMAPKDIAETLTGFQSGTMAPICHSVNSMLFVEENIVAAQQAPDSRKCPPKINVGSGMFGTCLSISVRDFIEFAKENPEGMKVCPLIQQRRERNTH